MSKCLVPVALAAACVVLLQVGDVGSTTTTTPRGNVSLADCRCLRRRYVRTESVEKQAQSKKYLPWIIGTAFLAGIAIVAAVLFSVLVAQLTAMAEWEKHDVLHVKSGTDSIFKQIREGMKSPQESRQRKSSNNNESNNEEIPAQSVK